MRFHMASLVTEELERVLTMVIAMRRAVEKRVAEGGGGEGGGGNDGKREAVLERGCYRRLEAEAKSASKARRATRWCGRRAVKKCRLESKGRECE